jgi:hypothetical protein
MHLTGPAITAEQVAAILDDEGRARTCSMPVCSFH